MENGLTFGTTDETSQRRYASANATLPEKQPSILAHGLAIGEEPLNLNAMEHHHNGGSSNISSSLPTGGVLGAWEAGRPRAPLVIHPPSPQPPGPPLHSPRPVEDTPKTLGSSIEFPTTANSAATEPRQPIGLGMPTPAHYKPAARTRGRVPSLVRVPSSSLLGFSEDASPSFDSTPAEQQAAAAVSPFSTFYALSLRSCCLLKGDIHVPFFARYFNTVPIPSAFTGPFLFSSALSISLIDQFLSSYPLRLLRARSVLTRQPSLRPAI